MAAGMIRLSMDPLRYAHPPAELRAVPERFPPCRHDSPCLPCEGADADDPTLPRAPTVIAEDNTGELMGAHPCSKILKGPLPQYW